MASPVAGQELLTGQDLKIFRDEHRVQDENVQNADLVSDGKLPCVHQTLGMSLVRHHGRHQLPHTFLKKQNI